MGVRGFISTSMVKKDLMNSGHKPFKRIWKKPLHSNSPRPQRMLLNPHKYDIDLKYKAGKENIIENALSRVQLKETEDKIPEDLKVQIHMVYENCPVTNDKETEITVETSKDAALTQASRYIING